jgi:hypothetical protein
VEAEYTKSASRRDKYRTCSVKILDYKTDACISLLNVTQKQARAIRELLVISPQGIRVTACWINRKPAIDVISSLSPSLESSIDCIVSGSSIDIRPCDALKFQKTLKAFGNRIADAARKPLLFQRVHASGKVHFAPSFHHIAACGAHCVSHGSDDNVNCFPCLLAAVTPSSSGSRGEYRPFGQILLRDAELFTLRSLAYKRSR